MLVATLAGSTSAVAQDTQQGVRLGLNYTVGSKPGVLVLPSTSGDADSVRAILQRDLDYDDRSTVVALDASSARDMIPAAGDSFNYAAFARLGVAAIVWPQRDGAGVTLRVYDVAGRRLLQSGSFPLPSDANTPAWRLALHGASDEVGRWLFGKRGVAQTRILYSGGDKQIWVVDNDGAGARRLTSPEMTSLAMSPAWNPNGAEFAYTRFTSHGAQIDIYTFATGASHRKRGTETGMNMTPVFAPDGKTIAYANGGEHGTDIMVSDVGEDDPVRRITVGHGSDNTSPTFSPDGHHIAFMSGRAGHPEVYVMDADGANPQLLTEFTYGEQSYRASPDWSPDGRLIAYESRIGGDFQIMTIDLRDRSTKQYTSDGENEDPSWAPDGRHLVFSSTRSGVRQLWVLDTESGRLRQLTHVSGARLPAWSPILKP